MSYQRRGSRRLQRAVRAKGEEVTIQRSLGYQDLHGSYIEEFDDPEAAILLFRPPDADDDALDILGDVGEINLWAYASNETHLREGDLIIRELPNAEQRQGTTEEGASTGEDSTPLDDRFVFRVGPPQSDAINGVGSGLSRYLVSEQDPGVLPTTASAVPSILREQSEDETEGQRDSSIEQTDADPDSEETTDTTESENGADGSRDSAEADGRDSSGETNQSETEGSQTLSADEAWDRLDESR